MSGARAAWEWRTAIAEWLECARRDGAPETTLRTRREHLQLLAKSIECGPWEVSGEQLRAWFTGRPWAPNTYRSRRTTCRAFYAWALLQGHVRESPALAIPRGVVPVPHPKPVPDSAYAAALAAAKPRERLMIRLAAEHGLRRGEIAKVWPQRDLMEDLGGWTLLVHGKGGRERLVPLTDEVAWELRRLGPGWAFPGREPGSHLTPRWIGTLLARLLPEGYTAHKLRHRAGTLIYEESGRDLALVQDILGHADPKTTRVYVQVDAARKRAAVRQAAARRLV